MILRSLTATALVLSLTACGGGGAGGKIDPVIASGPPPASFGALAGTTFPIRIARLETDGVTHDTSRLELSVTVVSDTELLLNTPEGAVTMNEVAGKFLGTLNGVNYSLEPWGLGFDYSEGWILGIDDGAGTTSMNLGYLGLEAPQAKMDDLQTMAAVATYSGDSGLLVINGGMPDAEGGTANLLVDFGASTVTGSVYETATLQMNIEGGTISGNGIGGTIGLTGPDSVGYVLNSSGVDGQFFGVDANVLHGTFEGQGTGPMGDVEFVGVFHTLD